MFDSTCGGGSFGGKDCVLKGDGKAFSNKYVNCEILRPLLACMSEKKSIPHTQARING